LDDNNNPGIKTLWPTTILETKLKNHDAVNPELLSLFDQYRSTNPSGSKASYVSPDNFSNGMDNAALSVLKTFIMDSVYEVARSVNEAHWRQFSLQNIDIDLTGLWFQVCNDYAFHETHVHGNCSWSGVYYVQAGSVSKNKSDVLENGMLNGATRFYGPNVEFSAGGHGDWGNYYLHDYAYTCFPEDGSLVVFPSHLKHMAFPYQGEKDRIIVSFHAQVNSKTEIKYNYSLN
jgi:hypothetical protein